MPCQLRLNYIHRVICTLRTLHVPAVDVGGVGRRGGRPVGRHEALGDVGRAGAEGLLRAGTRQ